MSWWDFVWRAQFSSDWWGWFTLRQSALVWSWPPVARSPASDLITQHTYSGIRITIGRRGVLRESTIIPFVWLANKSGGHSRNEVAEFGGNRLWQWPRVSCSSWCHSYGNTRAVYFAINRSSRRVSFVRSLSPSRVQSRIKSWLSHLTSPPPPLPLTSWSDCKDENVGYHQHIVVREKKADALSSTPTCSSGRELFYRNSSRPWKRLRIGWSDQWCNWPLTPAICLVRFACPKVLTIINFLEDELVLSLWPAWSSFSSLSSSLTCSTIRPMDILENLLFHKDIYDCMTRNCTNDSIPVHLKNNMNGSSHTTPQSSDVFDRFYPWPSWASRAMCKPTWIDRYVFSVKERGPCHVFISTIWVALLRSCEAKVVVFISFTSLLSARPVSWTATRYLLFPNARSFPGNLQAL